MKLFTRIAFMSFIALVAIAQSGECQEISSGEMPACGVGFEKCGAANCCRHGFCRADGLCK